MLLSGLLSEVCAQEMTVGEMPEAPGAEAGEEAGIVYRHRTYSKKKTPRRHEVEVEEPSTDVTILVSTPMITDPMAEFQAELRVDPKVGVAVLGGVGGYMGMSTWTVGAEGRGYVSGGFERGIFLALDVRYTNNSFPGRADPTLAIGPMFGAKYTFDVPLTVEAKVGVAYIQGEGWGGVAPSATAGIGWSF